MANITNKTHPMKPCLKCSNMLTDDATYCHVCNTKQTDGFEAFETMTKQNDTFLKVLCILTIIGAGLSLISLPISMAALSHLDVDFPMWILAIGFVFAVVKLTAAILMLRKKLIGLHIYTACAVLVVIFNVYSNIIMDNPLNQGPFTVVSTAFALLFGITFIVLYWLPVNRRLLS